MSLIFWIIVTVACSEKSNIDIGVALGKTEDYFRQSEGKETTASAFDGKKDIKFRLMIDGDLSEEDAALLFNRIMI